MGESGDDGRAEQNHVPPIGPPPRGASAMDAPEAGSWSLEQDVAAAFGPPVAPPTAFEPPPLRPAVMRPAPVAQPTTRPTPPVQASARELPTWPSAPVAPAPAAEELPTWPSAPTLPSAPTWPAEPAPLVDSELPSEPAVRDESTVPLDSVLSGEPAASRPIVGLPGFDLPIPDDEESGLPAEETRRSMRDRTHPKEKAAVELPQPPVPSEASDFRFELTGDEIESQAAAEFDLTGEVDSQAADEPQPAVTVAEFIGRPNTAKAMVAILAAVLVLVGLFFLGLHLPGWLGFGPATPTASSLASVPPSADPSTTPSAVVRIPGAPADIGVHRWSSLNGGECIAPFTNSFADEFSVVSCVGEHSAQLVLRATLPDATDAYPGVEALTKQTATLCTAPGVVNLVAAVAYSDLQIQASFAADDAEWASGQHDYFCFVSRAGGTTVNGSLVGTPTP